MFSKRRVLLFYKQFSDAKILCQLSFLPLRPLPSSGSGREDLAAAALILYPGALSPVSPDRLSLSKEKSRGSPSWIALAMDHQCRPSSGAPGTNSRLAHGGFAAPNP